MGDFLAALGAGGWAIVAVVGLLTALLFSPWKEPSRRAERLLLAWRGHTVDCGRGAGKRRRRIRAGVDEGN
jgi:hypothetical protein